MFLHFITAIFNALHRDRTCKKRIANRVDADRFRVPEGKRSRKTKTDRSLQHLRDPNDKPLPRSFFENNREKSAGKCLSKFKCFLGKETKKFEAHLILLRLPIFVLPEYPCVEQRQARKRKRRE